MPADISALNLDEIQEVMTAMNSFDNVFRDSSERERTLFLEMVIKRTLEKSAYQKAQITPKAEPAPEVITTPVYAEPVAQTSPIITPQPQEVSIIKPQAVTRVYGEQWVVIQNRLLNAITNLELNERRLIMFLSPIVRKAIDSNPKERIFRAKVIDFMEQYGIKSKKYYGEFEKIADSILQKVYYFWEDYKNTRVKVGANWVSECHYLEHEGALEIRLDDRMIEMLTVFDRENPFTKYERQMIVNLGSYGMILFEMIASCMYQQHKQKAYSIEYLREKFNCVETYPILADFKRYVIDRAIKDIEQNTPFRIKYTQKKKGRVVTELVFSFEDIAVKAIENKKKKGEIGRDPNTIDWVNGATDKEIKLLSHKQADYFASKLANNTNFGSKFARIGEEPKPFISRISNELQRDISKVASYMPYLISEGYSPTN
jgi:plasmid replication initiation protein